MTGQRDDETDPLSYGRSENGGLDPLLDGDLEHLGAVAVEHDAVLQLIRQGLYLLGEALINHPSRFDIAFPNDFACAACFARGFRQLKAATHLAAMGYTTEVEVVLRAAYESISLGRYLAHEPDVADRWLRKGTWVPEKQVQRWLKDWLATYSPDYFRLYGFLSKFAHPTSEANMRVVAESANGDTYSLRLLTTYDSDAVRQALELILSLLVWALFALRNAAVNEEVFPPGWRQAVTALMAATGSDIAHLQRDWQEEESRWKRLQDRIRDVADLDDTLREHPLSWENLRPQDDA